MPTFDILRKWEVPETYRTKVILSSFTLEDFVPEKRFKGNIPLERESWQIGVVVGRSGTGKTTIAKELFKEAYIDKFTYTHLSILDDFPEEASVTAIMKALSSVGFASPPDWLKSYDQLSQGEKMRVNIARALTLKQKLIVFDEFTSVIDRDIAHIACIAIKKGIKRTKKQFIAVTCHFDVIDWLEPDWVFSTDNMNFTKKKDDAPQLSWRSINAAEISGHSLGTITI